MGFGPCMCGDTECPSCGPLQGSGISIAEGVFQEWEGMNPGTTQDLADLCNEHDGVQTIPGQLDCEVWTFTDGSSIEIVWGSPTVVIRDKCDAEIKAIVKDTGE